MTYLKDTKSKSGKPLFVMKFPARLPMRNRILIAPKKSGKSVKSKSRLTKVRRKKLNGAYVYNGIDRKDNMKG